MELEQLEKLIDDTNEELLAGAPCKIMDMDTAALEEFMRKQERLYKACIQIRLQRSVKKFKVGLDFEKYAKQEKDKKEKVETKANNAAKTTRKAQKATKNAGIDFGSLMGDILSMSKNWCKLHNKQRSECGCVEETSAV